MLAHATSSPPSEGAAKTVQLSPVGIERVEKLLASRAAA